MGSQASVNYSFATPGASGNTTIVPAQTSQRIVVIQLCVIAGGADNVKFQSFNGVATYTDVSALFPLAANGGFVMPYSEVGWMQTNIGEALSFNQSFATPTAVQVVWYPSNS